MSAFEHVMSLISFVFALAIAHLLTCAVAIFRARSRVRLSFTHAAWMIVSLLQVMSWWLAFWDFRLMKSWDVGFVTSSIFMPNPLSRIAPATRAGEISRKFRAR
jgi:hypothetical protein